MSPDGQQVLSAGNDGAVRLWSLADGRCLRLLEGHSGTVWSVAWSADGRRALSASNDGTVRLWSPADGRHLRVLEGRSGSVRGVAWSPDGGHALSAANDGTVRLWSLADGRCLRVLEGHVGWVRALVWSPDGQQALSAGRDGTVRVWSLVDGRCRRVLTGHSAPVRCVAWSADGTLGYSADVDGYLRTWDLAAAAADPSPDEQLRYVNAKVVFVGDTGSGKTWLSQRLVSGQPPADAASTSGAWATHLPLHDLPESPGLDREIWLWDFGGQADQRLIHQLYLDNTALVVLMFGGHQESVLPGLREWRQALARTKAGAAPTLLVAGRTDVDCRFDRQRVRAWAEELGLRYLETSAKTGAGVEELRAALRDAIPWDDLTPHVSPARFLRLKEAIQALRVEGRVVITFGELETLLRQRLPDEAFDSEVLATIVKQLDGPGVVKELDFGDFILLRPEWINAYGQAVIRTLRQADPPLGCLPVSAIAAGELAFGWRTEDGREGQQERLPAAEERIVLMAMEQSLIAQRICLRQDGDLIFPSYCGRERPEMPAMPAPFVSYALRGFLDGIYTSLVVKLAHCGAYQLRDLWRNAAEFETVAGRHGVGIELVRYEDGRGTLLAWHGSGLSADAQVLLGSFIHRHLEQMSTEPIQRQRHYLCPKCSRPVKDLEQAMENLAESGKTARIRCTRCDFWVPLWDEMEDLCASESLRERVRAMERTEQAHLDAQQRGTLLVYEVQTRLASAGLICHPVDGSVDDGIDIVVQVNDDDGEDSGQRIHVQVKCGASYLTRRKRDQAEMFRIEKPRWVRKWTRQTGPVMLVIGTFDDDDGHGFGREKREFGALRWMRIDDYLKREIEAGRTPVTQIVFEGEPLDRRSILAWRRLVLDGDA